jgi:hypothetical protein
MQDDDTVIQTLTKGIDGYDAIRGKTKQIEVKDEKTG